jgi:hypothetical protein
MRHAADDGARRIFLVRSAEEPEYVTWNHMRTLRLLPLAAVLVLPPSAAALAQDSALIALAQRASVATLDSAYAPIPFDDWLAELGVFPKAAIQWEVNDCGEGGDGRPAPTCVEARINLARDTSVSASLVVAGLDGTAAPPQIWMLCAREARTVTALPKLRDLVAYMRRRLP